MLGGFGGCIVAPRGFTDGADAQGGGPGCPNRLGEDTSQVQFSVTGPASQYENIQKFVDEIWNKPHSGVGGVVDPNYYYSICGGHDGEASEDDHFTLNLEDFKTYVGALQLATQKVLGSRIEVWLLGTKPLDEHTMAADFSIGVGTRRFFSSAVYTFDAQDRIQASSHAIDWAAVQNELNDTAWDDVSNLVLAICQTVSALSAGG
jgi:hypothetical protein